MNITKPVVGFIGTGIMGTPMALHLINAGYRMKAWNRSSEKLQTLRDAGAEICATPVEAGKDVAALICMLSDGPTCDAVLFDGGVVSAMLPNATLIVMSSIPVETAVSQARRASLRGVRYIDAPVSGGQRGAEDARLAIMVGAAERDFIDAKPLLSVLGRSVLVGPVGSGQLTKLANQMIVASTIATISEALLFVERGGADPARVREALTGGFADSTILQQHGQRIIEENFSPGGPAKYQVKDTHTALAYAKKMALNLPILNVVDSLFEEMVAHGDGELDHSGLIRELRRLNGLPVAKSIPPLS